MSRDLMGLFINTLGSIIFQPLLKYLPSKIYFLAQILGRIDLDGAKRPVKVAFLVADMKYSRYGYQYLMNPGLQYNAMIY